MTAVESRVAALVRRWTEEAKRRQAMSAQDVGADVLQFCARELEAAVEDASGDDEELTPEQFGALHGKSASQVRRWCQTGRIEHRRVGRDYRIRRGAAVPTQLRARDDEQDVA